MSQAGIASRRASEKIIEQGRVKVNGKPITLGDKADPERDTVTVDGQRLKLKEIEFVYYVLNKPVSVLSTNKAPEGDDRMTVREMIPKDGHLFAIGRLDVQSEGLMVMTNDGDLTNRLAHPRYEHTKTYKVTVYGEPNDSVLEQWQDGVWLDEDGRTAPCYVKVLDTDKANGTTTLRVIMIEGKKRQIRRIAAKLGYPVKRLMRTHIGQLGIGTLRRGEWYQLSDEEVYYMTEPAWELEEIRKRRKDLKRRRREKRERNNPKA